MNQLGNLGKYHLLERLASDDIAEVYKVKTIGIAGFEKVQVVWEPGPVELRAAEENAPDGTPDEPQSTRPST